MIATLINEDKIHMEQNNIDNYACIYASSTYVFCPWQFKW